MNDKQIYLLTFPSEMSEDAVYVTFGELTRREPDIVLRPDALLCMWFVGKVDYGELLDYLEMKVAEGKIL